MVSSEMDELDSAILEVIQYDFPLCEKPYETIAGKLGISCDELWERIERLTKEGVIRRIGVSLDSHKFGYVSTLAAISIKPELVTQAAGGINRFPQVTHCYLRKDTFNVWFTVIAEDNRQIASILEQIRMSLSLDVAEVLNLPMKRLFNLDARFKSANLR